MKAMTLKKSEQMSVPAPASSSRTNSNKTKASPGRPRKTTAPALNDDNDDGDSVLSVKIPPKFGDTSSITNLDEQDESSISKNQAKSKKDEYLDDLDDAAAYIMDLEATENDDQPKPTPSKSKRTSRKEATTQKAKGKKAASKATSPAQKPYDDDDDFASPILPLAPLESDTQPTRETTPMLPNLEEEEEEDTVSLVKPIRSKRRIRKLTNVSSHQVYVSTSPCCSIYTITAYPCSISRNPRHKSFD